MTRIPRAIRPGVGSVALLALLGGPSPVAAEDGAVPEQDILFQVFAPAGVRLDEVRIELDRLDQTVSVPLLDGGQDPSDFPDDGVFVGRARGPYARYVSYTLLGAVDGAAPRLLDAGLVRTLEDRLAVVAFLLTETDGGWEAQRTTGTMPSPKPGSEDSVALAAHFAWAFLVLATAVGLGWLSLQERVR